MTAANAGLTKEALNGKTPTKPRILQALDTVREFNRLEPKRKAEFGPAYEARMAVAGSIGDIFGLFKVLLPATKYRLQVDKLKIEGEYAVRSSPFRTFSSDLQSARGSGPRPLPERAVSRAPREVAGTGW